jgi:hypothetical protein
MSRTALSRARANVKIDRDQYGLSVSMRFIFEHARFDIGTAIRGIKFPA